MSKFLCLLACAALPACSTLAQVDVTVDEVCLTYPNLQIPGPAAGLAASESLAQTFTFDDLAPLHDLLDYDADLQFVRAEVRTSDVDALAGIQRAALGIASNDPAIVLGRTVVYACDGDCEAPDASLELPAASVNDALEYLSAKSLAVDLSATGSLPAHAWKLDVDVCMTGHARYAVRP